jgi:hypothetical protein
MAGQQNKDLYKHGIYKGISTVELRKTLKERGLKGFSNARRPALEALMKESDTDTVQAKREVSKSTSYSASGSARRIKASLNQYKGRLFDYYKEYWILARGRVTQHTKNEFGRYRKWIRELSTPLLIADLKKGYFTEGNAIMALAGGSMVDSLGIQKIAKIHFKMVSTPRPHLRFFHKAEDTKSGFDETVISRGSKRDIDPYQELHDAINQHYIWRLGSLKSPVSSLSIKKLKELLPDLTKIE